MIHPSLYYTSALPSRLPAFPNRPVRRVVSLSIPTRGNIVRTYPHDCSQTRGRRQGVLVVQRCVRALAPRATTSPADASPAARKVRCDKALPGCRRCADAKRDCEGYGFRLSWPRSGDRKRASTATPSSARLLAATEKAVGLRYVNTTSWDIELHRRLSMARGPQIPRQIWPYRSLRDRHHPHASTDELTLVHYCKWRDRTSVR